VDPLTGTVPTDGEIEADVAFEVDQDRVDCCPAVMLDGDAPKDEIVGSWEPPDAARISQMARFHRSPVGAVSLIVTTVPLLLIVEFCLCVQ
jgi:hypothetical protein